MISGLRHPDSNLPRVASRRFFSALVLQSVIFLLILPAVFPRVALAQFTGPALPYSTPVNPPLPQTTDPAILYPSTHDIILDTGDVFIVHLYGAPDYAPSLRVGLDGTIQLPLIGPIAVKGLTVPQAENLIASRLVAAGMYRDPQISLQITESPNQIATVTGEMHGIIPVGSGRRLFDVLAAAGGLTATSSHTITIDRPGVPQPIILYLGTDPSHSSDSNIPVYAHDTIVVPRVGVVYLLGAFKGQAAIPLQQTAPLTLMKAAALGGGTTAGAKLGDLRIIRTVGQNRSVVHIDIKKVMKGEVADPVLEAEDIVFLPSSIIRQAVEVGGLGTLLGIASVLLYAFQR